MILAAVIASFVLGLGDTADTTPQASFDFEFNGTAVTITHQSGDTLNADQVTVTVNGIEADDQFSDGVDEITAGTSLDVSGYDEDSDTIGSGDTVRIVWESASGDSSSTLSSFDVPN